MPAFLLKTEMFGICSSIVWPFPFTRHKPHKPSSPRVPYLPPFSPALWFPSPPPQISFRPTLLQPSREATDLSPSSLSHSHHEPNDPFVTARL